MKEHDRSHALTIHTALLDKGAEVFTQKMFKHSQSKAQQRGSDIRKDRQEKMLAIRSRWRWKQLDRS